MRIERTSKSVGRGRSASEMALVSDDGRDDHLVRAHPLSTEAGVILLKVGNELWPTEYKPN